MGHHTEGGRLTRKEETVRRYLKLVTLGVVGMLALAVAWLAWALNSRPSLEAYRPYVMTGSERRGETCGVRVVFLGVCTLLIDDGQTAITRSCWPGTQQITIENRKLRASLTFV